MINANSVDILTAHISPCCGIYYLSIFNDVCYYSIYNNSIRCYVYNSGYDKMNEYRRSRSSKATLNVYSHVRLY